MSAREYQKGCKGCAISQGSEEPSGGTVHLEGGWLLNHYQGSEAFLGWLAMQPKLHAMELSDLNEAELKSLGPNTTLIDKALRAYWVEHHKEDPIERVYVVYFFESAHEWPPSKYHLHVHLIARPQSLRGLQSNGESLTGWRLCDVKKHSSFPLRYRPTQHSVSNLMDALRQSLT